jgi:hypothetical protein
MQQIPDFFDFFEHLDFGALFALVLSLLGPIFGGGGGGA